MEITNPNRYLKSLIGKRIKVKLKWGMVYYGILQTFDTYMNLSLNQTEEWINEHCVGNLGQVLIRCNNVSFIAESSEGFK
jgi:small nuclear ribonucleoprotein F